MIIIEEPKDLGRIRFGQPHVFSFEVTNEGPNPVELVKIVTGCTSCTKASTPTKRLDIGQKATINVTFTPGTLGKQKKVVNIYTSDSNVSKFEFTAESYEN